MAWYSEIGHDEHWERARRGDAHGIIQLTLALKDVAVRKHMDPSLVTGRHIHAEVMLIYVPSVVTEATQQAIEGLTRSITAELFGHVDVSYTPLSVPR